MQGDNGVSPFCENVDLIITFVLSILKPDVDGFEDAMFLHPFFTWTRSLDNYEVIAGVIPFVHNDGLQLCAFRHGVRAAFGLFDSDVDHGAVVQLSDALTKVSPLILADFNRFHT